MCAGIGVPLSSAIRLSCFTLVTGKMPGMMGSSEPFALNFSTSDFHFSTSKKNCVVAKVAPRRSFSISTSTSLSKSPCDAGWPSGNAATPIVNPPNSEARVTNSSAWLKPPWVEFHGARGPPVGSPRSARMLLIPASRYFPKISSSSSRVEPTHVKCATVGICVRAVISEVIRIVRSRVEPPAP